jgi:hypothetical protein
MYTGAYASIDHGVEQLPIADYIFSRHVVSKLRNARYLMISSSSQYYRKPSLRKTGKSNIVMVVEKMHSQAANCWSAVSSGDTRFGIFPTGHTALN